MARSFHETVLHFGIILIVGITSVARLASASRTCNDPWRKVLENDDQGSVIFGNKNDLVQAVLHGARVRFLVSAWGQGAYAAEMDNLSIKGDNTCGQALMHVSRKGWEKFQDNAYWWFLLMCTTGDVHMTRYNVGSSTFRGDTHTKVSTAWFVKENVCTTPVFSHSTDGSHINGSKEELATFVTAGYDIRAVTEGRYSCPFHNIDASSRKEISGQSIWHVSQSDVGSHMKFQSNAYWWFTILSTNGLRDMSRWTLGSHQYRGHTNDRVAVDWYADTCWRHVFTNDKNGKTLDGSLAGLIAAVESGQRVKVTMGWYSIEVDNVQTKSGQVSAQLLNHVSKSSYQRFQDNAYWYWQMVHTTGTVRTRRYNIGDVIHRGDSLEKKEISWFVDTRKWTKVLSTNKNSQITFGAKVSLRKAIQNGASVRVGLQFVDANDWYLTKADNLEFGPSDEATAQAIKSVSMAGVGSTEFKITDNPYWWFIIVSTRSNVDMSRWRVGAHTDVGHSSQKANVNWFVNY